MLSETTHQAFQFIIIKCFLRQAKNIGKIYIFKESSFYKKEKKNLFSSLYFIKNKIKEGKNLDLAKSN